MHVVPLITATIIKYFFTSVVPEYFKRAVVRPLFKRPGFDKEELNNHRRVSNLPYVSKLLNKVTEHSLKDHLNFNNLHYINQSSYRSNHSTETALLSVQNDTAEALDRKRVVVLVMLDLLSAFDVINHDIMLTRFRNSFGVTTEPWIGCGHTSAVEHNVCQSAMERRLTHIYVAASHKYRCWVRSFTACTPSQLVT